MNKAWNYLRENFKPDVKGRYKTVHAMEVAKYFSNENDRLISGPGGIMEMKQTIADLEKYRNLVEFIANDYIELSYDKAQWQRDDWMKRCKKLIEEMNK
jgi:hypothetical protein